jgi:L-alanine-DL-glutamate epimerase-like enolase superfamily enzyme
MPLSDITSGNNKVIKTYYGGIDLGYNEQKLLNNIEEQLKKGHNAFKIKVGKEDYREDIKRIKAVRKLIGEDKVLMIDANMAWDLEKAKAVSYALEEYNIFWMEEPINPDDLIGYRKLAKVANIHIAMGENLHIYYEHKNAIEIGSITYPQLDASNIGGITGWLEVAELAKQHNLLVSTHGMQELHVNLLSVITNQGYLEFHSFPIHEYVLDPLIITNGTVSPNNRPGIGVAFDWDKLKPFQVL